LKYLSGILGLEQVDGEETVVSRHIQRRGFTCSQEVRYVFHLDEGHGGLFELEAGSGQSEVGKSTQDNAVLEYILQKVTWW